MKTGWISLHRKIQDNVLWKDGRKFSRAEAWIDMLMEARHDEKQDRVMIGNTIITCDRGQSIKSIETWAMRWNWSRSAVHRFLAFLKRDGMVTTENLVKTIRITVCKYNTYQMKRNGSETEVKRKRNAPETEVNTDNNVKNANNDNNEKKKGNFVPPTVIEVLEYSKEINYNLNADSFINSYEQKGWMVGKNKMKCWKSAVRNWKSNGWGKLAVQPKTPLEKLADANKQWPPKEKP